jgi:LacI family transcriptional regulator
LRAVQETGYRPNIVSRSLRTGTTQTIGFVSDTVATLPFAGHLIWGALDAAREQGHLLFIAETEGDPELEHQLIEAMHDRQVDGIVLASMYTRKVNPPKGLLDGPAVLLNALPTVKSRIPSVVPDEAEAGRTAARVLVDAGYLDGICLVGAGPPPAKAPKDSVAAVERLDGIRRALKAAGAEISAAVGCSEWQPEDGYEAVKTLLKRRTRPRALICFNDRLALGAYRALDEYGLRIGDDVSIVSFDDDLIASWITPGLTTIALPHYELGRAAIELLLAGQSRANGRGGRVYRVPMPLRVRESVRTRELAETVGKRRSARAVAD